MHASHAFLCKASNCFILCASNFYYEQVLFNPAPRTLQPDRFSTFYPYFGGGRRPLPIEAVNQKYVLKQVAAKWLPAPVINHRKQGFEAPMARWLRGPLRALMQDTLAAGATADAGIFDAAEIARLQTEHLSGARKHSKLLFSLLMFHLWFATRHKAAATPAGQVRPAATFAA